MSTGQQGQHGQHGQQAETRRIAVTVNGEAHEVADACSVADLLEMLAMSDRRVAVAIDREVVPRSHFEGTRLAAGCRVEILEAVGGG